MKDFQGKTFENNSKQSNEKSEIWALKCQNTSKENIKIVIKVWRIDDWLQANILNNAFALTLILFRNIRP